MEIMYYYKATIRLNGNPMNEVIRKVSAPELLVIQFIHGGDSVNNVTFTREVSISMMEHKEYLQKTYNIALALKEQSIDSIFGALGSLPDRLPDHLLEKFGLFEEPDIEEEEILTVARKKSKTATSRINQAKNQVESDRENTILSDEDVNVADIME